MSDIDARDQQVGVTQCSCEDCHHADTHVTWTGLERLHRQLAQLPDIQEENRMILERIAQVLMETRAIEEHTNRCKKQLEMYQRKSKDVKEQNEILCKQLRAKESILSRLKLQVDGPM